MAASRKRFSRRGYHHGHLREALLAAARRLIAERGPMGFTLIEAARRAGVSAAAPYRHFKDRDALLAEVRRRGFEEFGARLGAAARRGHDPNEAFARMGEAYLAFARDEPGYYAAMFSAPPARRGRRRPTAREAGSFGALAGAIAEVTAGVRRGVDPFFLAYQVWALSHGVATLAAAGQLPNKRSTAILRAGVSAMIASAGMADKKSQKSEKSKKAGRRMRRD